MQRVVAVGERNGVPYKKGRTVREGEVWVNCRLSEETKGALEAWGQKIDRSVSYLLRRLAEEAIEQGRAERGERL